MTVGVEIYPIAIGHYDQLPQLLDVVVDGQQTGVDAEVDRVKALLADFDADLTRPWHVPMAERGGDAIAARLATWSDSGGGPTILYWVGHGWSDNRTAALAHARSAKRVGTTGISPAVLADHIVRWEAQTDGEPWLLVVFDACKSARVAELVAAELDNLGGRRHVVLLGTSAGGSTILGRFSHELDVALRHTFADDQEISVTWLAEELQRRLGGEHRPLNTPRDAVLSRAIPIASGYQGPLDARTQLDRVIRDLPDDERRHFLTKAQGGELSADGGVMGEPSWHFTGRTRERYETLHRLNRGGMTVVTGRAGSGKSALLGDIVVRSRPALADVLQQHGLLAPAAHPDPPPFHAAIHLTGLSADQLIDRLSADLAIDPPDRDQPFTARLDAFDARIRAVEEPLRIVADALDEAVDPLRVAAVLRRLGAAPHVSLLVGTRRSTLEGPDQPDTNDTILLDSLGVPLADAVLVERDPNAAFDYVHGRILAADLPNVSSGAVIAVARAVAAVDQEFLYTRLATYELLRQPELILSPDGVGSLGPDHRSVFAATVERLRADNPAYHPLLKALAVAQGRGAPIRDGVWAALASAVAGTPIPETAIHELIDAASPYLALDREDDQSVYRLAHRTFAEHFTQELASSRRWHDNIVRRAIEEIEAHESPNPYWLRHTSAHCAEAGQDAWKAISQSAALDQLRPRAVAADAMRSLFGRGAVPLEIAAIIAGAHHLETAPADDQWGLRQIFGARLGGALVGAGRRHSATWSVAWGALSRRPLHAVLTGHTGRVSAVAAVPLPDGRTLLATGSRDDTVRLWDPATGTPAGDPLTGHTAWVSALAAVPLPDGRTLLATGSGDDTVRLWDPATGTPAGDPLTDHTAWVSALAAVPLPDGRTLLATGSRDDTVRLWDPATGAPVGDPLTGHTGGVSAVVAVPLPDGRTLLATGSNDGTVRLWDPATGTPVGDPLTGHTAWAVALAAVPQIDGRTLLATGSNDGTVRLWDPATGTPVGDPLTGHTRWVVALAAVPLPDGRTLLATGSLDGTVRLWDPATGTPVGNPLTDHTGSVGAVAAVPLPDGRTLLATGSGDDTVRLWDPATGSPVGDPLTDHTGSVGAVAAVPLPDGRTLLATGSHDGTVRLWDPATGTPAGDPLTGHTGSVGAVAAVPLPDGRTLLAAASHDGTVRLWDPATGTPAGDPLTGHTGGVWALAAVPLPDGRSLLATGSHDGTVRLWDPATGTPVGDPLTGHTGSVSAVAVVPLPDGRTLLATGSHDDTVRLWDPATGTPAGDPLTGHTAWVSAVAAVPLPDGRTLLATGSGDETVRLWDPATGTPVGDPLTGHTGSVEAVAAVPLPDGRTLLATGSGDGTVRLWDAASAAGLKRLPVDAVVRALSPLGEGRLAAALDDGLLVLDLANEIAATEPLSAPWAS